MISKSEECIARLYELHSRGLTNRQIASELGIHHQTVGNYVKKKKLKPNGTVGKKLEITKEGFAICSKCRIEKPIAEFRARAKISYCALCRNNQIEHNINSDVNKFLADRYARLKKRCEKEGLKFKISKEYFFKMYYEQKGECFYTREDLICQVGEGLQRHSLSVDRLDPQKGYVEDNVVLCTHQANTMKSDLSIEEIRWYLPTFYNKIRHKKFKQLGLI